MIGLSIYVRQLPLRETFTIVYRDWIGVKRIENSNLKNESNSLLGVKENSEVIFESLYYIKMTVKCERGCKIWKPFNFSNDLKGVKTYRVLFFLSCIILRIVKFNLEGCWKMKTLMLNFLLIMVK